MNGLFVKLHLKIVIVGVRFMENEERHGNCTLNNNYGICGMLPPGSLPTF